MTIYKPKDMQGKSPGKEIPTDRQIPSGNGWTWARELLKARSSGIMGAPSQENASQPGKSPPAGSIFDSDLQEVAVLRGMISEGEKIEANGGYVSYRKGMMVSDMDSAIKGQGPAGETRTVSADELANSRVPEGHIPQYPAQGWRNPILDAFPTDKSPKEVLKGFMEKWKARKMIDNDKSLSDPGKEQIAKAVEGRLGEVGQDGKTIGDILGEEVKKHLARNGEPAIQTADPLSEAILKIEWQGISPHLSRVGRMLNSDKRLTDTDKMTIFFELTGKLLYGPSLFGNPAKSEGDILHEVVESYLAGKKDKETK